MDWVISVITVRKASILKGRIFGMATAGYFPDNWADEPPARLAEVISLEVDELVRREKGLDKTVADSFPASDPPSSIPNPRAEAL